MDKKHSATKRYPPELKERAVRMVLDLQRQDPSDHGVISRVARQLGVGTESLRNWVKQNQIDLIVAGSRGLSQMRSWLLGSVSRKLVHYSGCSVLIVRSQE